MSAFFDSLLASFRAMAASAPSPLQAASDLLPLSAGRLTTTSPSSAPAGATTSAVGQLVYGKTYSVEPERYQSLMERLL